MEYYSVEHGSEEGAPGTSPFGSFRVGGVVVSFIFMVVMNIISVASPFNGLSHKAISDQYEVYLTPSGYTFAIWGLIYLLHLAFVVYQAFPAQKTNLRLNVAGPFIVLAYITNGCWLPIFQHEHYWLSVLVIFLNWWFLLKSYKALQCGVDHADKTTVEKVLPQAAFGCNTAWVSVAFVANLSLVLLLSGWTALGPAGADTSAPVPPASGFDGRVMDGPAIGVSWSVMCLTAVALLTLAVAWNLGDVMWVATFIWAVWGIHSNLSKHGNSVDRLRHAIVTYTVIAVVVIVLGVVNRLMLYGWGSSWWVKHRTAAQQAHQAQSP